MSTRLEHTPRAGSAQAAAFRPLTLTLPRHSDRFILLDVGALLEALEEAGAEDIDANDVDLEARHINEQKIEKLCGLTAKASLVVGLYVDKFPPPPRQLILAERLSAGGFWLSSKKRWVTGLNLLPLGSVHRPRCRRARRPTRCSPGARSPSRCRRRRCRASSCARR